ncbi:MAG: hypothetical protein FJW38_02830 [Acidobacteria bacterium]|nr:hypothetical protein [Acidobacteriota bacterium]
MKALFLLIAALCIAAQDFQQAANEKAFEERMKGVTLVGYSTRLDREGTFGPERYKIDSVAKSSGETWIFKARMTHEGKEVAVPIPITVKWAGRAPLITLEDFTIPGFGTWTAHVVLSGNQYAGTWSGKNGGGQMFGKTVKE